MTQLTGFDGRRAALRGFLPGLLGLGAWLVAAGPAVAIAQPMVRAAGVATGSSASRAVAVAPFVNISGESSDDWVGAGIAETVAADLENLDDVSVVGREALNDEISATGLDPVRASPVAAERAAREASRRLGAAWLVTGSYQRIGDRMRITARLVDAGTGAVATGVKVDGLVDELFGLQDQVVHELGVAFDAAAERLDTGSPGFLAGNGNGNGNGNGSGVFGGVP